MPRKKNKNALALAAAASLLAPCAFAQPLPTVTVEGSRTSQLENAETASTGVVTQEQLRARPVYRGPEMLEATPGLVVTQHSGEGKASQFYLRGFNLDHGTDLRTTIDGMPVNQRSHAHGQGWTDLNFLIPELVEQLEYRKGPFHAGEGDFASAGAVGLRYFRGLEQGIASVGLGQRGYRRTLLADAPDAGAGKLLYALELLHNDGPFTHPDDYRRVNGVLRYTEGTDANGFHLTAMAYGGKWNATDQIPLRAVNDGRLGRFDAVDTTDGGEAQRYSLSGAWARSSQAGASRVEAYVVRNTLDLFSNFTYVLDDPVNGDQFAQPDRRVTSGFNASHTWSTPLFGRESDSTIGLQVQHDNIFNALRKTAARQALSTTREDHILESSAGLYFENTTRWAERFRTVAGVRGDAYRFDVRSDREANSGSSSDHILSPKLNLVFGPWNRTEFYAGAGTGFHSNDARGTTITVDPATGEAADRVSPLARSKGLELGVRSEFLPGLQTSFAVYRLDLASELLFVGDAGATEATRPSRRVGFEWSNYWRANRWLTVDLDLAYARARFRDTDPAGDRIPGAVEGVGSLAFAVDNLGPWTGALQLRWFGPRPLVEDDSVRSHSTTTLNSRIGYKFTPRTRIELEGYNLTNRKDSAIDYYYASRLPGEADAVADVHFHPIESRSFRVVLTHRF